MWEGGSALGEDLAAAPVPEKVVALALQSARLGQHVAHQEHGVGPRPSIPPVPVEPGGGLHPLVVEMVFDEKEGFRQPATLLRIAAGPIGLRDLIGQGR